MYVGILYLIKDVWLFVSYLLRQYLERKRDFNNYNAVSHFSLLVDVCNKMIIKTWHFKLLSHQSLYHITQLYTMWLSIALKQKYLPTCLLMLSCHNFCRAISFSKKEIYLNFIYCIKYRNRDQPALYRLLAGSSRAFQRIIQFNIICVPYLAIVQIFNRKIPSQIL